MFTELNNVLNLDEKCPSNGQGILITEEGTEGTFLIHHMISLYVKGGHNVCLIAFNQTFNHYNNVAMKMGVNLNTTKDNGCFVFVEGLKALGSCLLGQCTKESNHKCAIPAVVPSLQVFNSSDKEMCIKSLYETIEMNYKSLRNWQTIPTLVLIDDLSILIQLGISPLNVVWFMKYLRNLTVCHPESFGCLASFVHRDAEVEDDDINFVVKNLQHNCDIHLQVLGLPTGYSREVHGQLQVTRNFTQDHCNVMSSSRTVQFKIGDKNVHFFAKGTSSAVL